MHSRVDYCCSHCAVWEPRGNKVLLQRLQAVCNKFFRVIYNLDRKDSVRALLKSNGVLNIFQNYDFSIYKHMHKAINGQSPIQNDLTINNEFFFFKTPRIQRTKKKYLLCRPPIMEQSPHRFDSRK